MWNYSGGSKWGREGRAPPVQNFFIFMQFLRKIGQITPFGVSDSVV